jgi:hypothetical protein
MKRSPVRVGGPILACWAALALAAPVAPAAEPTTLKLLQTIPLKGAPGRLDHMAIDGKGGRLFVANLSNNSLDVVRARFTPSSGRATRAAP